MGLNKKQADFTRSIAYFLVWCHENGYEVFGAELYRTPEQARIYASQGRGIVNSVHCKKLAMDIYRLKGGTVTWEADDYTAMGEKWKSMHHQARWGGDFKNRDAVHFSFEHNGVM